MTGGRAVSARFRAPPLCEAGDGTNALVVAIDNTGITELGTGGIVRPVLIYAPKH